MQAMFSGEGADKFFQNQEVVNQRVYERAREVLSADQLGAFGKFQTNQLQMMRMGMSMARKFMAPGKTADRSAAESVIGKNLPPPHARRNVRTIEDDGGRLRRNLTREVSRLCLLHGPVADCNR